MNWLYSKLICLLFFSEKEYFEDVLMCDELYLLVLLDLYIKNKEIYWVIKVIFENKVNF